MAGFASDRTARAHDARGKWMALMMALFVNLLFIAVLVFSVSWQNRAPEAVQAELYAPPPVNTPRPLPKPQPRPEPPKPEPPKREPLSVPKPPPVVEKPVESDADIALKARQAAEQRAQQQAEQARIEREQRGAEARKADEQRRTRERLEAEARKEAEQRKAEEKRQAELRERQERQLDTMRAQAEREAQLRAQAQRESQLRAQAEREAQLHAQAQRESQLRAQAEQEGRARAAQAATGAARNKSQLEWIDRIRSRIRGYLTLPPDIAGNPEAIFDVVQLPTGEIIEVKLRKSSGIRAYDDAVQRAILKASPLPRPVPADLFQRNLELRFRPLDP
ncbi:MAG: cell envelope integrity protein TolA [Betaproteobacteria bacterium]